MHVCIHHCITLTLHSTIFMNCEALISGGSRIGEGGVLSGMSALARREFLKTTPTFGQNLAYSALNSFSLVSLAS